MLSLEGENVMKTRNIFIPFALTLCLLAVEIVPLVQPASHAIPPLQRTLPARGSSLQFIQNVGQFDERARFQVRGGPGALWLAEDALWMTVVERPSVGPSKGVFAEQEYRRHTTEPRLGVNLKVSFPGANPYPRLEPFDQLDTVVHYYHGSDPSRWRTDVPVWGGVRYVDLYPGIDLEITGENGRWTWKLVVRDSQFAISDARLRVEGSETVVAKDGHLHLTTAVGNLTLPLLAVEGTTSADHPTATRIADDTFEIVAPFSSVASGSALSSPADVPEEIYFGAYLGGSGYDYVYDIAVDGEGDIVDSSRKRAIYVTGTTLSTDFPTEPGGTSLSGPADIFVTKLKRVVTYVQPAYSAYIGGSDQDGGQGIALDGDGNIYVTGYTRSGDFPTTANAFDRTHNACSDCVQCNSQADGFVIKMDNSGALTYSSYLGGSYYYVPGLGNCCGYDGGTAIEVDAQGIAYVTGSTRSQDFPTTSGAYDTVFSNETVGLNEDTFVVKLNPAISGSAGLLYGAFVGGGTPSIGEDIAIDGSGNVYVTGYATGWGGLNYFPTTPGAYSGGIDRGSKAEAIVFKINPAGNGSADLLYSTFLGKETNSDYGEGIALDRANQVYISGKTDAPDFPTTLGAFDTTCGTDGNCNDRNDLFVSKLSLAGDGEADLLYSTFLGGNYWENFQGVSDIALDANGDVYVTGDTGAGEGFPITPDAYDSTPDTDWGQAFVVRLRLQGNGADDVVYGTYVGGSYIEGGAAIALDEDGRVYVTGVTRSTDFPVVQRAFPAGRDLSGDRDVFVFRLLAPPTPDLSTSTKSVDPDEAIVGQVVTFTVQLVNSGILSTTTSFTDTLPADLLLQSDPTSSSGDTPEVNGQTITWSGTVESDASVIITYVTLLTSTTAITPTTFNQAEINDGNGNVYTRWAFVNGYKVFMPMILRN